MEPSQADQMPMSDELTLILCVELRGKDENCPFETAAIMDAIERCLIH